MEHTSIFLSKFLFLFCRFRLIRKIIGTLRLMIIFTNRKYNLLLNKTTLFFERFMSISKRKNMLILV